MKASLFTVAAATVLLAACSTPSKAPVATAPVAAAPAPAPVAKPAAPVVATPVRPDYLNPASDVARRRSVYFGFDDNAVRSQDRDVVEIQGRYLAAHPNVNVRVEGNTDERGSAEYNLALGQRRAQSFANALKVYGAKDAQMEVTSWGKEKPAAQGHDEAAWSQNRRADVAYPAR